MNDDQMRAEVVQELDWDPRVDSLGVEVVAEGGVITVRGIVGSLVEKRAVTCDVLRVRGVLAVRDVSSEIAGAMHRDARLDASNIAVASSAGTVRLTGTVSSWGDHGDALRIAWDAAGVVNVIDDLRVTWEWGLAAGTEPAVVPDSNAAPG